jgi:hypothetical protein
MAFGLAVCLALTGCAVANGGAAEPSARVLNLRHVDDLVLPLDAYAATPAQRRIVQLAEKELMTRCLERLGLKADLPDPPVRSSRPNLRRYGITDEDQAEVFGYDAPEIVNRPRLPDLSPRLGRALSGRGPSTIRGRRVPEGGCEGEAERTLDVGISRPRPDDTITGRLGIATLERSVRDSRVRAVFARWSACMKRSGYGYPTPRDANRDRAFAEGGKQVKRRELATAVADVRCKKETNLVNVWAGVETAYQKLAVAQNKAALTSVRRAVETRLKNAAGVRPGPAR